MKKKRTKVFVAVQTTVRDDIHQSENPYVSILGVCKSAASASKRIHVAQVKYVEERLENFTVEYLKEELKDCLDALDFQDRTVKLKEAFKKEKDIIKQLYDSLAVGQYVPQTAFFQLFSSKGRKK
jgi:hypothetical protein